MLSCKIFIIICEGSSEESYISELNKFFRENSINIILKSELVGTGGYKSVTKKYKDIHKKNNKDKIPIIIWVDKDIYLRNNNNCMDNYKKKAKNIPDFLFNYQNFEDFLVLHENKFILDKWIEICKKHNHFITPLHSDKYIELLKNNIFTEYKKGDLPLNINETSLQNLLDHNRDKNIPIKSDFSDFLLNILK